MDRGVGAQLHHDAPTNNQSLRFHHPPSVKIANSHPNIPKDKSIGIDSMTGVIGDQTHGFGFFGSSSAGSFMRQIKSAIDAKVGASSRCPSLGGAIKTTLLQPSPADPSSEGPVKNVEYVLPSRRIADSLMFVYWRQVHPLYPFLDPEIFPKVYESVWTESPLTLDERILMCTLNTVFALACQLSGSIKPEDREGLATSYFRRAQDLLQLDLWDAGSPELIQCLLLMGQYLQSTSSPHQCWSRCITRGLGIHG